MWKQSRTHILIKMMMLSLREPKEQDRFFVLMTRVFLLTSECPSVCEFLVSGMASQHVWASPKPGEQVAKYSISVLSYSQCCSVRYCEMIQDKARSP